MYLFKKAAVTEVMRQRGDTRLIEMLNKIRFRVADDTVELLAKSRLTVRKEISYPIDPLHLLVENAPADAQNNQLNIKRVLIKATNIFLVNLVFPETDFEFIKNAKVRVTGYVACSL